MLVALELDRARQLSQDLSERISRSAGFLAHDFNNFISIIKLHFIFFAIGALST